MTTEYSCFYAVVRHENFNVITTQGWGTLRKTVICHLFERKHRLFFVCSIWTTNFFFCKKVHLILCVFFIVSRGWKKYYNSLSHLVTLFSSGNSSFCQFSADFQFFSSKAIENNFSLGFVCFMIMYFVLVLWYALPPMCAVILLVTTLLYNFLCPSVRKI